MRPADFLSRVGVVFPGAAPARPATSCYRVRDSLPDNLRDVFLARGALRFSHPHDEGVGPICRLPLYHLTTHERFDNFMKYISPDAAPCSPIPQIALAHRAVLSQSRDHC